MLETPSGLVVFDADDVLWEFAMHSYEKNVELAEAYGWPVPSWETYKRAHPLKWEDKNQVLWPEIDPAESIARYKAYFTDPSRRKPCKAIAGANEAIAALAKRYAQGILTSRPDRVAVERVACEAQISLAPFEFIQTAADSAHHKPDPRVFAPINGHADKRGIAPNRRAYVGDHTADWEAARAAGYKFAAVLTGITECTEFLDNGLDPRNILASIANVPDMIDRLMAD